MSDLKSFVLNSGHSIPSVGFGVYLINDADECERSVLEALKDGYRHVDTANAYMNERAVGRAMKKSGLKREEIFLTTKLWPSRYGREDCIKAIDDTLERLDTPYIDLLLLHQPYGKFLEAYQVMEEYVKMGKVRSIGLSNFSIKKVKQVLGIATIIPAVDQVECHPYYQQRELEAFLNQYGIKIESWYPLGHGDSKLMNDPAFKAIGERHGKTPVQVILRWHIQSGKVVLPKSTNPSHILSNIEIFDFELTPEEMETIARIDKNKPYFVMTDEDDRGFSKWDPDFNKQK